jgi:hypothetical protein
MRRMTNLSTLRRLRGVPTVFRRMLSWLTYKVVANEENRVGYIFFLTYVSQLLEGSTRIIIPVIIVSLIFLWVFMILHYDVLFTTVLFVDSPATMTATFFEVPKNKSPSSFRCCKCAANNADFFCAPKSLQCPVEVIPLCWNCYIRKKPYVWKVVKQNWQA